MDQDIVFTWPDFAHADGVQGVVLFSRQHFLQQNGRDAARWIGVGRLLPRDEGRRRIWRGTRSVWCRLRCTLRARGGALLRWVTGVFRVAGDALGADVIPQSVDGWCISAVPRRITTNASRSFPYVTSLMGYLSLSFRLHPIVFLLCSTSSRRFLPFVV